MKREHLIAMIRTAGYHEDPATYTRLLVENRISFTRAKAAFAEGQRARENGVRCTCRTCVAAGRGVPAGRPFVVFNEAGS